MDRKDATDSLPEEFVVHVRDALVHLYDYAHLERHPLVSVLCSSDTAIGAGRALRNRVLDAIEELHPDDTVARGTRGWRAYDILTQRYVDGYVVDDILESLHISLRQFQREQRRALLAVSMILWRRRAAEQSQLREATQGADSAPPNGSANRLAMEVERMGVRLEALDVSALIRDALAPIAPFARQKQAQIVVAESLSLVALVDHALVRQALVAVLSSLVALGATRVDIGWRTQGEEVVIRIQADMDDQQWLLVRDRLEGINDLLYGQGGRLELAEVFSGPRCVLVHLRGATGLPVLVVDDDRRLRQLFGRYLESEGFRFRGAGSAQEALSYLDETTPQVIVMDVMMREMDGWQLLQLLRSRQELATVPIIVCSVLNEPGLAEALGAQLYLRKPVGPQTLLSALHQTLGGHGQQGQG